MSVNSYFLLENGEKTGPFSLEELYEIPVSPGDKVMPENRTEWIEASDLPEFVYFFKSQGVFAPTLHNAGGFWLRLAAYFIDVLCLVIISVVLLVLIFSFLPVNFDLEKAIQDKEYQFEIQMISFCLLVIYHSVLESTNLKASFGKYLLGMAVVDEYGFGLTFLEALKRNLGKIVSSLIFGVGYLMILWTDRAQALHDRLANTFVVSKNK